MTAYNVFAFRKDETIDDERRDGVPGHRLDDIAGWAFGRGHDTVLIEVADRPHVGTSGVTHHVCADPGCPGGC